MKIICIAALLIASTGPALAQSSLYGSSRSSSGLYGTGSNPNSHYVQPYVTPRGNSVGGHYQTNPNSTQMDNYGTRGNVNPYTGTLGTRRPGY